jgi:hypothetical protein
VAGLASPLSAIRGGLISEFPPDSLGEAVPLELIIGAAVGAAAASKDVRRVVRQGVVYGLAGILVAYDKVADATQATLASARRVAQPEEEGKTAEETPAPSTDGEKVVSPAADKKPSPITTSPT